MNLLRNLCIILSAVLVTFTIYFSLPYINIGTAVVSSISEDQDVITVAVSNNLSIEQQQLLGFAYTVAKQDGMTNPAFVQGILLQESNACHGKNWRVSGLENKIGNRYFGCGQVKLAAARDVLKEYPDMMKYLNTDTDEEIQARLILDDEFNVRITSKYLMMMGINKNPAKAITAYNVGPGAVKNFDPRRHDYTVRVQRFTKNMKNVQIASTELELNGINNIILASEP